MTTSGPRNLRSEQTGLIDVFRGVGPGARVALVAPAGTGKTTAVLALIDDLQVRDDDGARVLYIVNRIELASQLERRLSAAKVNATVLSKRLLREYRDVPDEHRKDAIVSIVLADAVEDEWFRQSLRSRNWDLIVVDDVPEFSLDLLGNLDPRRRIRTLVVSSVELAHDDAGWIVVKWESRGRELIGRPGAAGLEIHVIPFWRSPFEQRLVQVAAQLDRLAGELNGVETWESLYDLAQSSAYALQAACLRNIEGLRRRRNELAHGLVGPSAGRSSDNNQIMDAQIVLTLSSQLESIVDQIDVLDGDTHLAALKRVLSNDLRPITSDPVVVFTSNNRTRDYLIESLAADLQDVGDAEQQIAAGGVRTDSVVVASDRSLQGIQIRSRRGLSYDVPFDRLAHAIRVGHLNAEDESAGVDYWGMADMREVTEDESNVFSSLVSWIGDAFPV